MKQLSLSLKHYYRVYWDTKQSDFLIEPICAHDLLHKSDCPICTPVMDDWLYTCTGLNSNMPVKLFRAIPVEEMDDLVAAVGGELDSWEDEGGQ